MKPFAPPRARDAVLTLTQPAVFTDMTSDWPALRWNAAHLSGVLGGELLRFRIGRRTSGTDPLFETECDYADGTLHQFLDWVRGTSGSLTGPFGNRDPSEYWAYADYKYLAHVFKDKPEILKDIVWADFGFPGRDGQESTLWVGSSGANTPCHIDSYGCNLVLQVEGRKTWHLFPPEDAAHLYPTRIPYEESSVFSKVNVVNPDWSRFPLFSKARPHVVTLHPGQVLFVPRHWWHYVESVDDITVSINSWIELDSDHEARVEEAVARMIVCAFKSVETGAQDWLNPTEGEATSHETNLQYVNQALAAYAKHETEQDKLGGDGSQHNQPPKKKKKVDAAADAGNSARRPPFGKHLVPVEPKPGGTNCRTGEGGRGPEEIPRRAADVAHVQETQEGEREAGRTLTGDEVLDCLVNPQVIRLVTRLLIQKRIP
ncbi:HSPB1-associated protein 1 [Spea bombifrons]|uniref:HSPB1-associated protein 1 n=1 Tax=Spea bombifrons TaxID=233779 RepID=UPI002349B389|nr:HSPB1-associated protein 1 [Spea bombifrons]XP_053327901.1 HSPB1-associated protein 1 [Spea bombifrons]